MEYKKWIDKTVPGAGGCPATDDRFIMLKLLGDIFMWDIIYAGDPVREVFPIRLRQKYMKTEFRELPYKRFHLKAFINILL